MTRLTYEDIETLTLAPYRALCAMGASPARAYARAVVPEIASGYLTNALYLLETQCAPQCDPRLCRCRRHRPAAQ